MPAATTLAQYTGYLLRRAYVVSSDCARACVPEGPEVREVAALAILAERGPLSQQVLGRLAHLNRSTVVKLVDDLETKGWVVRERSVHDRRTYALTMTDTGRSALAESEQALDRGEAALTRTLSADETARLRSLLAVLLADDPSVGISSLCGRSGYLIAQAHRALRDLAAARLQPLGLHPRDFGLLATLGREQPCSQTRLAAGLGVTAPGVLPRVTELEEGGLLSRVRKSGDRRVYDLTLTEQGQQVLEQAQQVAGQIQAELRERLGEAGDEELRALLSKLLG